MAPGPGKPYDNQVTDESGTSALVPSGQDLRDGQTTRGEMGSVLEEPSSTSLGELSMPSLGQFASVPAMDAAASLVGSHVVQPSVNELSSRSDSHENVNLLYPQISNRHPPDMANMLPVPRLSYEPATNIQRTLTGNDFDNRSSTINQITIASDGHCRTFEVTGNVHRPFFAEFHYRHQSFLTSSWRNDLFVYQLANAGFYSTGGKNVKCFACNNELDSWEDNDDPFFEHAYWFGPRCPFVQAVMYKRQTKRYQTAESNEERSRVPYNGATVGTHIDDGCTGSSQQHIPSLEKQLKEMGFDENTVRFAIQRRERASGHESLTMDGLIEDLFKMDLH